MDQERVVIRPRSGLWLALAVWALCLLNLVTFIVLNDWVSLVRCVPAAAFVATAVWMLFGIPAVIVEPDAVVLVNPARDVRIPWNAIIDVQPSFSLLVRTVGGRYRAWAAPGGSQAGMLPRPQANEQILLHSALPDDGRFAMSALVDPARSDQSTATSAAAVIRQGWRLASAQRQANDPAVTAAPVTTTWRTPWLIVLGVLFAASVAAVVVV